ADPAGEQAQGDLLRPEDREVDEAENEEEETADEFQPQSIDEEGEHRRAAEGDLDRSPDLLDERRRAVAAVEAGGVKQQAPDREDEDEQEAVFLDRRDRRPKNGRKERRQNAEAQHICHRQRQRRQDEVPDQYP